MPMLVKEAKAQLSCAFDSTLDHAGLLTDRSILFPGIADGDPHNFQIMNLLQEMNLMAPLPLAMYHCFATCPLKDIVEGYKFNCSVCSLSPANLRSFIYMKNVLEIYRVRLAREFHTSPTCHRSSCRKNIHRLWSEYSTSLAPFDSWAIGTEKVFLRRSILEQMEPRKRDKLLCEGCKGTLEGNHRALMNIAWGEIPRAFGFNNWAGVAKSGDFPSLTFY